MKNSTKYNFNILLDVTCSSWVLLSNNLKHDENMLSLTFMCFILLFFHVVIIDLKFSNYDIFLAGLEVHVDDIRGFSVVWRA